MTDTIQTPKEVAVMLRITERTLRDYRSEDRGPTSYKPQGKVIYYKSDVDAWIKSGGKNDSK